MTLSVHPKAVVFDLLTALLDSWSVWDKAIPSSEKSTCDGQTWRKRYLELTYGCGVYEPYESLVAQSAKDVGLSEKAPEVLLDNFDQIQPWSEVPAVLVRLRNQGMKLGVVTNCSTELGLRAVRNCCATVNAKTGKEFDFDAVVTAEESGFYKPNPKPYNDLLAKLRVQANETVFVAGSSSDIPGAAGVGMRVVWHNRVGLERKDDVLPMREGGTLDEAMQDILGL